MNIRDLKYLVAVAEHRHFGRAAEASFVSQPTLSMQLKKLEEELGVILFERTKKQVLLTDPGIKIVAKAKQILAEVAELKTLAEASHDPIGGVFRLGAFPTLAPYLLPLIVPTITRKMPNLKLLLVEEKTADLLTQLKQGTIDAALIALPVQEAGIEATRLFQEPFLLAAPKHHPLSAHKTISAEDIKEHAVLLLDEGHCLRDQALDLCHQLGGKEADHFRATSLETLRQMVVSGSAITLMPQLAIRPNDDSIQYIPFAEGSFSREIALCMRSGYPRTELVDALATLIRAQADLYLRKR